MIDTPAALQVAQLTSGVKVLDADPSSAAAPTAEDLQRCFEQLQGELASSHSEREQDLLQTLDDLQSRHVALRTNLKTLSEAYRQLRYQVEDAMAQGTPGSALAITIVHEAKLLHATPAAIVAKDEVRHAYDCACSRPHTFIVCTLTCALRSSGRLA